MAAATPTHPTTDERRDALVERLFMATVGTMDVLGVYIGDRLGLYRALAERGPSTSQELAGVLGLSERYVREWLEQQAAGGILELNAGSRNRAQRRYSLPAGHDEALLDETSLNCIAPIGQLLVACVRPVDAVLQAFRTGDGVPVRRLRRRPARGLGARHPADIRSPARQRMAARGPPDPRAAAGRPAGAGRRRRLRGGSLQHRDRPRVPQSPRRRHRHGRRLDRGGASRLGGQRRGGPGHLPRARRRRPGASRKLRPGLHPRGAARHVLPGPRPVSVPRTAGRRRLGGGGGRARPDEFDPPSDEVERLYYGFSVLHCLPVGMVGEGAAGTGTVMRASTVREYAEQAGFTEFEVLPIENDFYRFYRLAP